MISEQHECWECSKIIHDSLYNIQVINNPCLISCYPMQPCILEHRKWCSLLSGHLLLIIDCCSLNCQALYFITKKCTFCSKFRIPNRTQHHFIIPTTIILDSSLALTRSVHWAPFSWCILIWICHGRHSVSWTKFRTTNQWVQRYTWGDD